MPDFPQSPESVILSPVTSTPLLRCYHSHMAPGTRDYLPHRHTAFEMSLVLEGSGLYQLESRTYRFGPGDIFLFTSNEIHYITSVTGKSALDILNIHFEPRFVWAGAAEVFDAAYLDIYLHRTEHFSNRIPADDPRCEVLTAELMGIRGEFDRQETGFELMVKIHLLKALVLLQRTSRSAFEPQPRLQNLHLGDLELAISYIDSHLSEPLTLEEIASRAHLSRTYFSTLFRQMNGITPWEYITAKRIEAVNLLLASDNRSIAEIAEQSGYTSTANFYQSYRNHMRLSPGAYRRQMRKRLSSDGNSAIKEDDQHE